MKKQTKRKPKPTVQRRGKKPSLVKFKLMCELKGANITEIARAFGGVERQTIYNWMEADPKFRTAFDDVKESKLDFTESQAQNLIKGIPIIETDPETGQQKLAGWHERPSEAMIIFTLKTLGKDRGYVERGELTGKGGKDLIPARTLTKAEAKELLNELENDC